MSCVLVLLPSFNNIIYITWQTPFFIKTLGTNWTRTSALILLERATNPNHSKFLQCKPLIWSSSFKSAKACLNPASSQIKCVCIFSVMTDNCSASSLVQLNVSWYLRNSHCYNEVFNMNVRHTLFLFIKKKISCFTHIICLDCRWKVFSFFIPFYILIQATQLLCQHWFIAGQSLLKCLHLPTA